jgi:hypothetical protein
MNRRGKKRKLKRTANRACAVLLAILAIHFGCLCLAYGMNPCSADDSNCHALHDLVSFRPRASYTMINPFMAPVPNVLAVRLAPIAELNLHIPPEYIPSICRNCCAALPRRALNLPTYERIRFSPGATGHAGDRPL